MGRQRFDRLVTELSVRVGRLVPRYELWLRFHELGIDPEWLTRAHLVRFCERHLAAFLDEQGFELSRRQLRRLIRAITRGDPALPTPEDWAERLGSREEP